MTLSLLFSDCLSSSLSASSLSTSFSNIFRRLSLIKVTEENKKRLRFSSIKYKDNRIFKINNPFITHAKVLRISVSMTLLTTKRRRERNDYNWDYTVKKLAVWLTINAEKGSYNKSAHSAEY